MTRTKGRPTVVVEAVKLVVGAAGALVLMGLLLALIFGLILILTISVVGALIGRDAI